MEERRRCTRLLIVLSVSVALLHLVPAGYVSFNPDTWVRDHLAIHLQWSLVSLSLEWVVFWGVLFTLWRRPKSTSMYQAWAVLFALVLTRVSWWASPPSPSEDVWRYLWDGERSLMGLDTYLTSPAGTRLNLLSQPDSLLETLLPRVGHPEIKTVYPPGAQLIFWLCMKVNAYCHGGMTSALLIWRMILLVTEGLLLLAVHRLSRHLSLSQVPSLCYIFCPILSFECALAGHLDIIGVACVLWALERGAKQDWSKAGGLLALGAGVKLLPILILYPFVACIYFKGLERFANLVRLLVSFTGVLTILCLPFLSELIQLGGLWPGLKSYGQHWSFNASLYAWIEWFMKEVVATPLSLDILQVRFSAKLVSLSLILMILSYGIKVSRQSICSSERRFGIELIWLTLLCQTVTFLVSPVVYSWYLLWIVPPVCLLLFCKNDIKLNRWAIVFVVMMWSCLSGLTYQPRLGWLMTEKWSFKGILSLVEYGTLWVTFALVKRYTPSGLIRQPIQKNSD